jgi:hypothetical protein
MSQIALVIKKIIIFAGVLINWVKMCCFYPGDKVLLTAGTCPGFKGDTLVVKHADLGKKGNLP